MNLMEQAGWLRRSWLRLIHPRARVIIPFQSCWETPRRHKMADRLLQEGIYVVGFSYPVVPKDRRVFACSSPRPTPAPNSNGGVAAFATVGRELTSSTNPIP